MKNCHEKKDIRSFCQALAAAHAVVREQSVWSWQSHSYRNQVEQALVRRCMLSMRCHAAIRTAHRTQLHRRQTARTLHLISRVLAQEITRHQQCILSKITPWRQKQCYHHRRACRPSPPFRSRGCSAVRDCRIWHGATSSSTLRAFQGKSANAARKICAPWRSLFMANEDRTSLTSRANSINASYCWILYLTMYFCFGILTSSYVYCLIKKNSD